MSTDISEKIQERDRTSALIIISLLAILIIAVGILLLAVILPKNGLITEINENGEEVTYYYCYGEKRTGWKVVDGYIRYFSTDDGTMLTGKQIIDGKEYYFVPPEGKLAKSQTITFDDGTKVYYDYKGAPSSHRAPGLFTDDDGTTALYGTAGKLGGWHTIDGTTYYFQMRTGRMLKNEKAFINGKYYIFDENGIATELESNDQSNTD